MKNNLVKKNNPKVSIVTVCYNEEKDIENTCKSVASQNYNSYEWIVIDGGSTDKTLETLDKYKSNISVLISEKDRGVYDAMNKGIKKAKGEYLLFLNGGDYLYKNNILKKVFHENFYKGDVLYGNCCVLRSDGRESILDFPKNINKYFFIDNCINHQSTFIKRNLFEKFGIYDESYRILADYEKWIYFINNRVIFKKIPFIISNFKGFDGLSTQEKTRMLNVHEREIIINKYFNKNELLVYKFHKYMRLLVHKSLRFIKIIILKIFFLIMHPRNVVLKYRSLLLNSSLRQPVRKFWYFIINKKINN